MPLSQSLMFSSRHAGSQSSTRTPSRDLSDSRLPLLRTPKSHPTPQPRPASSLGFRSLFNSLGSHSSRKSKTSIVTRLKAPTPPTPTTPSVPLSSRDNPRSTSPLKRGSDIKSPFQLHHPPAASPYSSVGHGAGSRRIPRPVPEQRDPKWKDVEAEWRRQARHLNPSHQACLLGAVCIDIRDPLKDMTADNFRSYVKSLTRRTVDDDPQTPRPGRTQPPTSLSRLMESPTTPTPSRLSRHASLRSREVLDRPRPFKRRCQTPDPFQTTAFPLCPAHAFHQTSGSGLPLEPRRRAHSMPVDSDSRPAPEWHRHTRVLDAPESPSSIISPLRDGQNADGDDSLRDWTVLQSLVSRSPSPLDECTMKARKSMLKKLERVIERERQVLPGKE